MSVEPYFLRLTVDGGNLTPSAVPGPTDPSYPVFVDPMGMYARSPVVGDSQLTKIPRVNLQFINTYSTQYFANLLPPGSSLPDRLALRFCSQMDGLTYRDDGSVDTSKPAEMRELRYNWLWVVQRPVNRDRYTVRMQVVVFDKRAHQYAPSSAETELVGTAALPIVLTPGDTAIRGVPLTAELRKGSWIMDAGNLYQGTNFAGGQILRHAEFYRVLSVSADITSPGGNTALAIEVHRPVTRPDGLALPYNAMLVSMPSVADVFERPLMTANTNP